MDPAAEHLGRLYAEALLAAASKAGVADAAVEQLQQVVGDVIGEHPSLAAAMASPRVEANEKVRILDKLFADQLDPTLLRFLKVVAQRGRLGQLAYMAAAAREMRDEALGRVVAEVRSAVPLDDELKASVSSRLGDVLQKEVVIREKVDPELIGGLVIRVGDTVFDGSVAGRLSEMSKRTRRAFAHQLIEKAERFAESDTSSAS